MNDYIDGLIKEYENDDGPSAQLCREAAGALKTQRDRIKQDAGYLDRAEYVRFQQIRLIQGLQKKLAEAKVRELELEGIIDNLSDLIDDTVDGIHKIGDGM